MLHFFCHNFAVRNPDICLLACLTNGLLTWNPFCHSHLCCSICTSFICRNLTFKIASGSLRMIFFFFLGRIQFAKWSAQWLFFWFHFSLHNQLKTICAIVWLLGDRWFMYCSLFAASLWCCMSQGLRSAACYDCLVSICAFHSISPGCCTYFSAVAS